MATIQYLNIPVPTPKQSQLVKVHIGQLFADVYRAILTPGYVSGVPNVYKVLNIYAYVLCDATVANRVLILEVNQKKQGETTSNMIAVKTGNITASQQAKLIANGSGYMTDLTIYGTDVPTQCQIKDLYISGDDQIAVTLSNPQTNDYTIWSTLLEYQNHKQNISEGW